jgi:hypothetical protein
VSGSGRGVAIQNIELFFDLNIFKNHKVIKYPHLAIPIHPLHEKCGDIKKLSIRLIPHIAANSRSFILI